MQSQLELRLSLISTCVVNLNLSFDIKERDKARQDTRHKTDDETNTKTEINIPLMLTQWNRCGVNKQRYNYLLSSRILVCVGGVGLGLGLPGTVYRSAITMLKLRGRLGPLGISKSNHNDN
jgi:hypothetical protein